MRFRGSRIYVGRQRISRIPSYPSINSLVPINKLPPEILPLVAAFLYPGRQLINATAVCQHWRATLLSSPRLWNRIRSSNPTQVGVYLERSKSVPLKVRLRDLDPHLFELLAPHNSRLASLAVSMADPSDFHRVGHYLGSPIPTLRKFSIITFSGPDTLGPPSSGTDYKCLLHVKKLRLEGMPSFRTPCAFPHVTELKWHVRSVADDLIQVVGLLDTMEQLPMLERVEIVARIYQPYVMSDPVPQVVTLPHVQRMTLRCPSKGIPHILQYLKLPNLTSLLVDAPRGYRRSFPTLPVGSFGEHLPNFTELLDTEVYTCNKYGRVTFRGRQASFEHFAHGYSLVTPYRHDRKLWGDLPLHSIRRLIIKIAGLGENEADRWLVGLLRDLGSLEHLGFEGYCGRALRRLRQVMKRRGPLPRIKTVTVRSGADEIRQAQRLKDVSDGLGMGTNVTCIPDPEILDTGYWEEDGMSEDWDWSDEGED